MSQSNRTLAVLKGNPMTPNLIPLLRDAQLLLEAYSAAVTHNAQKRRILRTALHLERYIAEHADTLEAII